MIRITTLILISIVFSSCSKKQERIPDKETISSGEKVNALIERDFPDNYNSETFDTLISDLNIRISLTRTPSQTFVTDEFEVDSTKYIHRYHDYTSRIIVIKDNITKLDTLLTKSDFTNYTSDDFRNIAIFDGHQFSELGDNKIVFFGSIGKPETDWHFAFDHIFNLESNTLKLVEYKESESI